MHMQTVRRAGIWLAATLAGLALAAIWSHGCASVEGCMGGDDGRCLPPSPCQALAFRCDDPSLELRIVHSAAERPPGLDALAARGDVVLGNSRMQAVIDAIDAPHHLAPTGGSLIDLIARDPVRGSSNDELNQMLQAAGILPDDEAHYQRLELLDRSPAFVAVIARGHLHGHPDVDLVTRYEVRPCEPGIRVRSELFHGGRDPQSFLLSDGYWWGNREVTPFVPLPGQGFVQPELDLLELGDSIFEVPYVAAPGHQPGAGAYGTLRCDAPEAEAFQSTTVSAIGRERSVVLPGDALKLERFVAVAHGPGASGAIDHCLEARRMLFGDANVLVRGRVVTPSGEPVGGDERRVSLELYEPASGANPDDAAGRTPRSQTVPGVDGRFALRVPADRRYRVRPYVLGRPLPFAVDLEVGASERTMPDIVVPPAGVLEVSVADGSGQPVIADVVLTPAPPTKLHEVDGSIHGAFHVGHCAPYLGPPHGGSPACNRVLLGNDGAASFAVPEGRFYVYASRGPFATLARETVTVTGGSRQSVALQVEMLPGLLPDGVLSADFHVHAGASFDSSLPETDRALSFVSSGVQVLAATDHDVVTSYGAAIAALGIGDRVVVMPGVETTGQFLFLRPPGSDFPKVIGHYNFWPLRHDRDVARNGAPDDERLEPGQLFDRVEPLFDGEGVRQLNHPFADSTFGRDEGYLRALEYDPRVALAGAPDDSAAGQLRRRPGGGFSNSDHHAQEVMNGASLGNFVRYRSAWFSFLNQGLLKAGTANSDSHTLAVEVMGYPRNLVFGGHTLAAFDRARFNADVRAGRMVGTNGPVLVACVDDADGACQPPSLMPLRPAPDAALHLEVKAAPWIAIDELRIIVNGRQVRVIDSGIVQPADPFAGEAVQLFQGTVPLSELLVDVPGDAWIVVEAGKPLLPAADLDDDGVVDTTDNNGDGRIDDRDEDGGYRDPPRPADDDPRFHVYVVAPGTYPTAFTNPFVIDRQGDGWEAPGL